MKQFVLIIITNLIILPAIAFASMQTPMQMAYSNNQAVNEALLADSSLQFYSPLKIEKDIPTGQIKVLLLEITKGKVCLSVSYEITADRMGLNPTAKKVSETSVDCPQFQEFVVVLGSAKITREFSGYTVHFLENAKMVMASEGVDSKNAEAIISNPYTEYFVEANSGVQSVQCEQARLVLAADQGNFLPLPADQGEMWTAIRVLDFQCFDK